MKRRIEDAAKEEVAEGLVLLEEWVAQNSFTRNREGVNRHGEQIWSAFRPLGFERHAVAAQEIDHGDHLLLTRRGTGAKQIALVAHLDTVYPPDEEKKYDFAWRDEGGRIYGPGVADIKGGNMLMLATLRLLSRIAPLNFEKTTWQILLNAAEEEGCEDFPPLARDVVAGNTIACLIYEHATRIEGRRGCRLTTSRRGAARFKVEAFGRGAHAGSGHAHGANAIRELARAVEKIEAMTDRSKGLTYNVGRFTGGMVSNTVPSYAECLVDMRADETPAFEEGIRQITRLTGPGSVEAYADGHRCSMRVSELAGYPPWPANEAGRELGLVFRKAGEAFGLRIDFEHRLGASDGNHLWNLAPTIDGLGPVGSHIHCPVHDPENGKEQESIERASLLDQVLLGVTALMNLTGASLREL